jgi:hypothetical protein
MERCLLIVLPAKPTRNLVLWLSSLTSSRLTDTINLAQNSTMLKDFQTKHDLTSAWIIGLIGKANAAGAKLEELKANATLVKACGINTQTLAGKWHIIFWSFHHAQKVQDYFQ